MKWPCTMCMPNTGNTNWGEYLYTLTTALHDYLGHKQFKQLYRPVQRRIATSLTLCSVRNTRDECVTYLHLDIQKAMEATRPPKASWL